MDLSALDATYPLPPSDLPRQWILTGEAGHVPDRWRHRTMGPWHLGSHPDAHVAALRARDGTAIGWVLEPLAQFGPTDDVLPGDDVVLALGPSADAGEVERALYGRDGQGCSRGDGLQGSWVAIVFTGSTDRPVGRVYLGAAHSVVYDPERRIVATTHNLVPDCRRDVELSQAFDPLATRSYFTFGLTAFAGVHRLLPNHYLDLDTFTSARHWPLAPLAPFDTGEEGAAAVVAHSQRLVAALLARHRRFRVLLSAGRDSRAVLAVLRPFVDEAEITLATTVGRDLGSRIDLQAARRLARTTGLTHEVLAASAGGGDPRAVLRAFVRIGESKAGSILAAAARAETVGPAGDDRFVLAGMAGETGRSFFWRHGPPNPDALTPSLLAQRTKSPLIEPVLVAAERWLQTVPGWCPPATVLDLLYIEQRLGCWESPSRYLFPGRPLTTSPMASSANLEAMLRLPEPYRGARALQRDMVAHSWPELLQVPFNQPRGLLRVEQRVRTTARNVGRLRHVGRSQDGSTVPGPAGHRWLRFGPSDR